jgi:hypothetical protein
MKPIYLRNVPGNIVTYDHISIIEHLSFWIKPESYLEIGVYDGNSLNVVSKHSKTCHAVDIEFRTRDFDNNVVLYEMSSDDFFIQKDPSLMFDFVFIDGNHSKEQVYKDFINVSNFVIEDGFVLLHDTSPCNDELLAPEWCHDAWESALKIKKEHNDEWEILTLPFNPGLTILKKMKINKQLYRK